jgi:hypothetical protein
MSSLVPRLISAVLLNCSKKEVKSLGDPNIDKSFEFRYFLFSKNRKVALSARAARLPRTAKALYNKQIRKRPSMQPKTFNYYAID